MRQQMFLTFTLFATLVFRGPIVFAATVSNHDEAQLQNSWLTEFLTPSSYEMHQVEDDAQLQPMAAEIIDDCRGTRLTDDDIPGGEGLNQIIAIGEKLWRLIEAGRPVVNYRAPVVHALPLANICWTDLESWRPPVSKVWEVNYKNGFGVNVVKFRFRVVYTPGGKYEENGAYLANVTVMPAALDVAWGYTMNAETIVGRAINLGTKKNPIAGLQLLITWNVKTIVKDSTQSETIFIRGD